MAAHPRTTSAIRFPPETHERLVKASELHGLTMNWLVVRAVTEFLDRLRPPEQWTVTDRPLPPPGM